MTRTILNLQYPVSDETDTIQTLTPVEVSIPNADGVEVKNAFACKDNTLTVVVANSTASAKNIIFKKGVYPNAVLGDLTFTVEANSTNLIKIENPSRLEQTDGGLLIDFEEGFVGTIYATGKKAGLKSVNA